MVAKTAKPDEIPEEGKASAPAGGRKKLIIVSALAAVLAIGAGGYAYNWQRSKAADAERAAMKKKSVFFDLPEITVNLASAPGQERPAYLKLKLALEIEDQKMIADIQPLMPRIVDNFQI